MDRPERDKKPRLHYVAGPAVCFNPKRLDDCAKCGEKLIRRGEHYNHCAVCGKGFHCNAECGAPQYEGRPWTCAACYVVPISAAPGQQHGAGNMVLSNVDIGDRIEDSFNAVHGAAKGRQAAKQLGHCVGSRRYHRWKCVAGCFAGKFKSRFYTLGTPQCATHVDEYIIPAFDNAFDRAAATASATVTGPEVAKTLEENGLDMVSVLHQTKVVAFEGKSIVAGDVMKAWPKRRTKTVTIAEIMVWCYQKHQDTSELALQFCVYGADCCTREEGDKGPGRNTHGAPGRQDATTASDALRRARIARKDYIEWSVDFWQSYKQAELPVEGGRVLIQFGTGFLDVTPFYDITDADLARDEYLWSETDHVNKKSKLFQALSALMIFVGYPEVEPGSVHVTIRNFLNSDEWHNVALGCIVKIRLVDADGTYEDHYNEFEWKELDELRKKRRIRPKSSEMKEHSFPTLRAAPRRFKCEVCGAVLPSPSHLGIHMRDAHGGRRPRLLAQLR